MKTYRSTARKSDPAAALAALAGGNSLAQGRNHALQPAVIDIGDERPRQESRSNRPAEEHYTNQQSRAPQTRARTSGCAPARRSKNCSSSEESWFGSWHGTEHCTAPCTSHDSATTSGSLGLVSGYRADHVNETCDRPDDDPDEKQPMGVEPIVQQFAQQQSHHNRGGNDECDLRIARPQHRALRFVVSGSSAMSEG